MAIKNKRTTIYLEPDLYTALRMRAVVSDTSVSEIVNDIVRDMFSEDVEDLAAFEERKNEPDISYEEMMRRLKKDGLI